MLVNRKTLTVWNGSDPINGIKYPPNIGTLWSAEELAAIGLHTPVDMVVPEDQEKVGAPFYQETDTGVMRVWNLQKKIITPEQVNAERDRRIQAGVDVTLGEKNFRVQTRHDQDFRNINGLVSKGILLLMSQDPETTPFRDEADVTHDLSGAEMISMGKQVGAHVSFLYQKAWDLKALDPIPLNYTSDEWWV